VHRAVKQKIDYTIYDQAMLSVDKVFSSSVVAFFSFGRLNTPTTKTVTESANLCEKSQKPVWGRALPRLIAEELTALPVSQTSYVAGRGA